MPVSKTIRSSNGNREGLTQREPRLVSRLDTLAHLPKRV